MNHLPPGWTVTTVGAVTMNYDRLRVPLKSTDRAARQGQFPYYGAQGIIDHIDGYLFEGTYLLIAEDGANLKTRSQPIAHTATGRFWVNNHAHVVQALDGIELQFLKHFLNSSPLGGIIRGTAQPKLTKSDLNRLPVPLPTVAEQQRIVDILEDHLSRLDAADANLHTSLRRLVSLESAALSCCREGIETPLAASTDIQGGIQKQQKRAPALNAYPFLRVANVTKNGLDLEDVHLVELFTGELDRLRLKTGDLLVVEGNGSASQIGRAALWDGSIENCVHQNHLIRVRPREGLIAEYLEAVWNSPQNRRCLTDLASSSSGLHTLSVSKLKTLTIPVPLLERQLQLIKQVGDVREGRRRIQQEIDRSRQRSSSLRQSLLSAAFAGRLTGRSSDLDRAQEMANV
jgi:type I restriction enzyme S subunit